MRNIAIFLILLCCNNLHASLRAGENHPVEEVLAVVGDTPILRSDLMLAAELRLIEREADESSEAYGSRLLDARIRLELQFRDLEAAGALHRMDVDAGSVLDRLVGTAGGAGPLLSRIESLGLAWSDLEELALRLAAVDAFVQRRLRPRVTVTLAEIEDAYQSEIVDGFRGSGQQLPGLEEMRTDLHRLLVERKLNDEIELWLADAEERQEVTRFSN